MTEHAAARDEQEQPYDRRAAVRRIATAVGLGAGAVALPALTSPASAKPGDAMRVGAKNSAGDAQTSLQGSGSAPTLKVENTQSKSGLVGDQVDLISPQLQLSTSVPSANRPQIPDVRSIPVGGLGIAGGAVLMGADLGRGQASPIQVHTSAVGNLMVPIPTAIATVFDTTNLAPERRGTFPAEAFDGSGRLAANVRMPIDLRGLINSEKFDQLVGACLTLTAAGGDFSGAVNTHSDGEHPGEVTVVSYNVLPAGALANGQPLALAATGSAVVALDALDRLWVSATSATHLRVQLTAVIVPDPSVLVEPADPSTALTPEQRRRALQRQALREMTASQPNGK